MHNDDDLLEEVVLEWNMLQENLVCASEQFKPIMDRVVDELRKRSRKDVASEELHCAIVAYNEQTLAYNNCSTVDEFNKVIRALNQLLDELEFPIEVVECPAEYDEHHHNGTSAWNGTLGPEDEETLYPHDER